MSFRFLGRRWSIWVVLVALLIVLGLFALMTVMALLLGPKPSAQPVPTALFTVIAAPTSTALALPGAEPSPTPTNSSLIVGGIGTGMYVQISGTGGDGLRLRSGPGINQSPRFLGHESEVFQVKDGPKDADGYTWWFLVTPMDPNRSGWAAATFLSVVASPTP